MIAVITIVALRFTIGMHFYMEGAKKFRDPKPYSAGFLNNAKGPFAGMYHGMVWDKDGFARLNKDNTINAFRIYKERSAKHFALDEKQIQKADKALQNAEDQANWFYKAYAEDISEYVKWVERREQNSKDAARSEVASLWGQSMKTASETKGKSGPLLANVETIFSNLENSINKIPNAEQKKRGHYPLPRLGRRGLDSESIDGIIRWFDVTVGVLLIFGLFTRFAALFGAAFLLSVVVSQWPGAPGAIPVWPWLIEMLALLVLASVGAGKYFGLDFWICVWRSRCCSKKQESTT